MSSITQLLEKTVTGKRLSFEDYLKIYEETPLSQLGKIAELIASRLHPDNKVTFVIDRNINYTNICTTGCKFCAFYRVKNDPDSYTLSHEHILEKIRELRALGGTQVLLQGGHNPNLRISYFEELFRKIRDSYPEIDIHSLSAPEIDYLARLEKLSYREVLERLHNAGLKSLPGGGAEILDDEIRTRNSPNKIKTDKWLEIHKIAHTLRMKSTATMVFGFGEKPEHRIKHLLRLRDLQDETGGFTAFIPWSFQSENTNLEGDYPTGEEYLRIISISRIVLDNFQNIQAGWLTEGIPMAQLALFYGANDFGGILMEEHVVYEAGVKKSSLTVPEVVSYIRDVGKIPVQRDTYYNILKVY